MKQPQETTEWERLEIPSRKIGTFHVRIGMIKDRSGMDLIEAEEIKKRWQENTENYTKVSMTQITTIVWSLT